MPKDETPLTTAQKQKGYEYTITYAPQTKATSKMRFSPKEISHLTIAALLVIGVGLSLFGFQNLIITDSPSLTIFIVALAASFFTHEMAHKLTAQRKGFWAEFRLTLMGAALTLLSVISPIFKVISPGAVMVSGFADAESMGKISIVGPATNIMLSTAFLAVSFLVPQDTPIAAILMVCAAFNAWIALFNLIPFGIFDGFKVFVWNKKIWLLAFTGSLILTAIYYGLIL
jgi:Zn-dependent protease